MTTGRINQVTCRSSAVKKTYTDPTTLPCDREVFQLTMLIQIQFPFRTSVSNIATIPYTSYKWRTRTSLYPSLWSSQLNPEVQGDSLRSTSCTNQLCYSSSNHTVFTNQVPTSVTRGAKFNLRFKSRRHRDCHSKPQMLTLLTERVHLTINPRSVTTAHCLRNRRFSNEHPTLSGRATPEGDSAWSTQSITCKQGSNAVFACHHRINDFNLVSST